MEGSINTYENGADFKESTAPKNNHDVKIYTNQVVRTLRENNIPVFIAYYTPDKGFQYNGCFPEELPDKEAASSLSTACGGKFFEFLKLCIGFNKEDYFPVIKKVE